MRARGTPNPTLMLGCSTHFHLDFTVTKFLYEAMCRAMEKRAVPQGVSLEGLPPPKVPEGVFFLYNIKILQKRIT